MPTSQLNSEQREWAEQVLLRKTEPRLLWTNALLAGEMVAIFAAIVWIIANTAIGLSTSDLPFTARLGISAVLLFRRFTLLVLFVFLCLGAGAAARWAAVARRTGSTAASLVFSLTILPVSALVFEQFAFFITKGTELTEASYQALDQAGLVGMYLLLFSVFISYSLWKCWWYTFSLLLLNNTDVNVEAEMERAFAGDDYDWRTLNRRYIELKREVLLARKSPLPLENRESQPRVSRQYRSNCTSSYGWVLVVLALLFTGLIVSRRPNEAPALPPQPEQLTIWFSGSEEEAHQLSELVSRFQEAGGLISATCVNVSNIGQELRQGIMTDSLPNVILAEKELIGQMADSGLLLELQAGETGLRPVSTVDPHPITYYEDLSSEKPWRPRLGLAVLRKNQYPEESRMLVTFLTPLLRDLLE